MLGPLEQKGPGFLPRAHSFLRGHWWVRSSSCIPNTFDGRSSASLCGTKSENVFLFQILCTFTHDVLLFLERLLVSSF